MVVLVYVLYFIILPVIALIALIYYRVKFSPLKRIPGLPCTRPIFGTFLTFAEHDCALIDMATNDRKTYGTIWTSFLFFGKRRINISDPYWMRHILATNSKNYKRSLFPGVENIFFAVGENGLIVVDGEVHKKLRKIASPAFKLSQLKKIMPIIEMCGERMVNLFLTRCNENEDGRKVTEITVKEILNKTTLDVVGLIAFGHDFKESCTFDKNTFGRQMRDWMDTGMEFYLIGAIMPNLMTFKRFMLNLTRKLPNWLQTTKVFMLSHFTNCVHDLVDSIVQTKIEEKRSNMTKETNNNSKSLFDFILESNDSVDVSQQEVHDLLMTFLIAGHETSTLAVTWSLYLLAKHPEYQEKCRKEVKKFFDELKGPVEWEDVGKLTFMNAVVHESLRLYPPVPMIPRTSIGQDEINGYYIPPESEILLMTCDLHRNAEYWTNPEDFIPERFLEPHDTIPWESYMPFGEGIHKCIGYQLALTEIVYLTTVFVNKFDFSVDPLTIYKDRVTITMQPNPPLKLRVKIL